MSPRPVPAGQPRPWSAAMAAALYGPDGFYRRTTAAAHFRTSVGASALFAAALRRLAASVDAALGAPDPFDVVDVGAGDGALLQALATDAPSRWRFTAVEVAPRGATTEDVAPRGPALLDVGPGGPTSEDVAPCSDGRLRWRTATPTCTGLLVANEWLDNVPCDVVELTGDGLRLVLEDDSIGPPPDPRDAGWLARWWPLTEPGDRAEVGRPRDQAWAAAVGRVERGLAVAIDYAHTAGDRPAAGTLTGYRDGRQVLPVADGCCDLTAHVALDACAAAADARDTLLTTQRAALRALGLDGRRPAYGGDPAAYLLALSRAGEAAELLDPAGLGRFGWLVQTVGMDLAATPLAAIST